MDIWQALQPWLLLVLGLVCGVLGWLLRELWEAVKELRRDIRALEASLPSTYARRDDVKDYFEEIVGWLRRLDDKLDKKADKE